MNHFKNISQIILFALLTTVILLNMAGSATATGQGTVGQEKLFIANVQFIAGTEGANDTINLAVANIGPNSSTILGCLLKDASGNVINFIQTEPLQYVIEKGGFSLITISVKPDIVVDQTNYTLTVITVNGGSFVSPAFDISASAAYDPVKDTELQSKLQAAAQSTISPTNPTIYAEDSYPNVILIGTILAAAASIMGAYKLSGYIVGAKNTKDRYVLFFFASVIFVSIIIALVSPFLFPPLHTM